MSNRIPCPECQVERDETGLDNIWCSSPECWIEEGEAMSRVVSQALMFDYLGEEVNVILHNGTSYWRKLIAVFEERIMLAALQDSTHSYPTTIQQKDIRSFGTREYGILEEVSHVGNQV